MKKVIAIDGPCGAGKSTIAKRLAARLGYEYLDTGALYRAIALHLLRKGLGEDASDGQVSAALGDADVVFTAGGVVLNGADVSAEIRTPEAGHYASVFSARKPVREFLLAAQRSAALTSDLVAEGRDMTTVVFPEAAIKFYLDASAGERARRRTEELAAKGFSVDSAAVSREIAERDRRDSTREIAPLRRADDAVCVDSTGMDAEQVLGKMLEIILQKASSGPEGAAWK